jgi:nucleotide-binding universal stress UspA family protein
MQKLAWRRIMIPTPATNRISFKRILFLTDFSEPSCDALPIATGIARAYGSTLDAVHVLLPLGCTSVDAETPSPRAVDQEELAEAEMQRVDAQLMGLARETFIERGASIGEVLARLLREREYDLIVMGTHGRTGSQKAELGSCAEEVFRRSHVPVLMKGPALRTGLHSGGRFRCILFATDFNAVSSLAAPYAQSLAQENGSQLILLHVLPAPKAGKTDKSGSLSIAEAMHKLADLFPRDSEQWSLPQALVEHGKPVTQILTAAKNHGADLIVLGVRGVNRLPEATPAGRKHIAYEVIAKAPCPVLTVRGES